MKPKKNIDQLITRLNEFESRIRVNQMIKINTRLTNCYLFGMSLRELLNGQPLKGLGPIGLAIGVYLLSKRLSDSPDKLAELVAKRNSILNRLA